MENVYQKYTHCVNPFLTSAACGVITETNQNPGVYTLDWSRLD